jgi:4-hydroxybenzoate polyprenyltransferase
VLTAEKTNSTLSVAATIGVVWRLMRPRHWVKNGFVAIGPLFANVLWQKEFASRVALTVVGFCLISSGVYIINDLFDRKSDANHPTKKNRPLASGQVSPVTAISVQLALILTGLVIGYLASPTVLIILALYLLLNVAYSLQLKHVVILDVFILASGFMLRILAGTSGIGVKPSQWLLLCGLMIALFLGFAKRRAELAALNGNHAARKVLNVYSPALLDQMIVVTATCVVITYSLYTMSPATIQLHHTDSLIYTVPLVMYGIFRYLYSMHKEKSGGDPATELFRDPHILFAVGAWLLLVLILIRKGSG